MRVLVFQHDPYDRLGYLGEALERRGADVAILRLDLNQPIPSTSGYDMLLVMGGDMNVYAEAQHPWLAGETDALRRAVEVGKPVLGVCLGGQLLAKALGASVHLGAAHEIGLVPIDLGPAGRADPLFASLQAVEAVEWHDDTFDVPAGGVALAGSQGCANQAFRYGHCYGLQFHPEVSPDMLADWIRAADGDVGVDLAAFQEAVEARSEALNLQADRLIENFLRQAGLLGEGLA